jgi:molybdopterin-guanine dinucleotide biosynthesis protein A
VPDPRTEITGLVLAGGRGSRMGGADKGLLLYAGEALAARAVRRLASQVGTVAVNANRNLAAYAALGVPVWPDTVEDRPGPLAGLLAGMTRATTPWLVAVPCDVPHFPTDLVARLAEAVAQSHAEVAIAVTREGGMRRAQPTLCLLQCALRDRLATALAQGQRRVEAWTAAQARVEVCFDDPTAFANLNSPDDLAAAGT